jgi:hypothetical protein
MAIVFAAFAASTFTAAGWRFSGQVMTRTPR